MPNKTKKEKFRSGRDLVEIKRTVGGKRMSFYGKTKAAAEENYEEAKNEYIAKQTLLNHGITPDSNVTFKTWAEKWLEIYKYGSIRDITYDCTYESPTLKHLIPYFADRKLKDIKPSDIRAFFKEKGAYSYSQLSNFLLCLKGIFSTAIDDELISKNPVRNIRLPKASYDVKTVKRAYTPEQAKTVIDFAKTHKYGVDVLCLLVAGMRKSEMLALPLRYENEINGGLDLERGMFRVRQSVSESKYGIQLSPCKTDKSSRDIPIDKELLDILQTVEDKIYYQKSDREFDRKYLVSGMYGEIMRPVNWQHRHFERFKKDFELAHPDIPMLNPHELRHSFGSILYSKGVDIVTISKLMGHSSIEITVKLYVHDDITLMQNAIETGFSEG